MNMPGAERALILRVAAALLGAQVMLCARVGDDQHGKRLRKLYGDCGIDLRFIHIDSLSQTGLAVVIVEKNGVNRIVVYPGANSRLSDRDIEEAFAVRPEAVLTQFEIGWTRCFIPLNAPLSSMFR